MIWALIDLSFIGHRALYSMKGFSHKELPTGVIFGVLEQIRTLAHHPKIRSNNIAFFCDSKKSYRKMEYPDYKRKRHESRTEEELAMLEIYHQQLDLLIKEILPDSGFPVFRQVGLESDDLIAQAAITLGPLGEKKKRSVIVSSDGDLYQCISWATHYYDPNSNTYYEPLSFWKKKAIEPYRWAQVKAIAGCSSDNVEGIAGVGEKTAIDYLLGVLPTTYKKYQAIVSKHGKKIIKRNTPLVTLPHSEIRPFEIKAPFYSPQSFFQICRGHGIITYNKGEERAQWERFFNGEFDKEEIHTPARQVPRKKGIHNYA